MTADPARDGSERDRLRFWHPVLRSDTLRPGCADAVEVAGRKLALFRTRAGQLGAIVDECAHRRMKLSLGKVEDDRLICPYHGWSFTRDGAGESPSAPKMHACVTSYDCAESAGVIWVKARGAAQPLPSIVMNGWTFVGALFKPVRAPLELVIDNFGEIEHTIATHADFGIERARAAEAVVQIESIEDALTVRNSGPAKMPPFDTRFAVWVRPGDLFHSNYTFRFDPPRSSVDHFWTNGTTGQERLLKYHIVHYFVPTNETSTTIVTFGFLKTRRPLLRLLSGLMRGRFRRKFLHTVNEDAFLLENLADQSTDLTGMTLSRFDRVLSLTREGLRRVYNGDAASDVTRKS